MKYKRILLKLSGEIAAGTHSSTGFRPRCCNPTPNRSRRCGGSGRTDRHRHRRRQHLPRPHGRQAGLRPREGRPDGNARHDHQLAGAAIGARGQRRQVQGAHVDPHGARRRILLQGPRHRVPRGGLRGDRRRRHLEPLLHDRSGRRAARHRDRGRRPAERHARGRRLHGRSGEGPRGREIRRNHLRGGARPQAEGHGPHRLHALPRERLEIIVFDMDTAGKFWAGYLPGRVSERA